MEKVALSSVGPGMMLLDTSPVASEERSYATPAGRGNIVLNQSVYLAVMKNMASVTNLESASVVWVSVAVTVTTASVTQDAFMAPASSPGSVTARRDGVDSSATRI